MTSSQPLTFESNYFFPQVFVVKALIHDGGGQIQQSQLAQADQNRIEPTTPNGEQKFLFIQEPETSSWKPGKLGLAGGKSDPGEDWLTTLDREIREELNTEVIPEGILSVEEIVLLNPKTNREQLTHHVIVVCQLKNPETQLAANAHWFTLEQLQNKPLEELTEYYFPALFEKAAQGISGPNKLAPLNLFHVMNGIHDQAFQDWFLK